MDVGLNGDKAPAVAPVVYHEWLCSVCNSGLYRIFLTQAHPVGRQGGLMIKCAGCGHTIMEQRGGN